MKNNVMQFVLMLVLLTGCSSPGKSNDEILRVAINKALDAAVTQSINMAEVLKDEPGKLPRTLNENGELVTSNSDWWCSGFFPGELWYLYENTGDSTLKKYAHDYTMRVKDQQYTTTNHDVGFMIFCSFGNAYRVTKNELYRGMINTASKSLITRFNPLIGAIRSWDYAEWNKQWQYPVIIDNMMNLEILMWASKEFDNPEFAEVAITHANTTIKNHFRKDNSSYHVVSYDTTTGILELKQTSQGYSDESAWARGQAWGLYGFTMMFRESGDTVYLNQAKKIADFIIDNPKMPEDKIPYWDFNAPDIPNAKRDASAGAIMCSALLELSGYCEKPLSAKYLETAKTQLVTLCSEEYLAEKGTNGNFILKHGVGHMPNHSEVDAPLSYADYYFVEALMRYKKLMDL
jgi:unsaturated chondroitin disaccharide hydrolase